ncbi:MAG: hypothetical protein P8P48_10570 [Saprospiraceae bacterium]|nr:hypothetical protein [Saprospiraceae bacterium]
MKSLLLFLCLPFTLVCQIISPLIYADDSYPVGIVSDLTVLNNATYACQISGDSFGTCATISLSKFNAQDSLILSNQYTTPFGSITGAFLLKMDQVIYLLASYYNTSSQNGGLSWAALSPELELEEFQNYDLGNAYVDRMAYDFNDGMFALGGTVASSPFEHRPFALFLDAQMDFIGFKTNQTDAYSVESILLFDDFYLLLGGGIWKYNMEHELINSILFESPNEIAKTKAVKLDASHFVSLRRSFIWDSGLWQLALEKWDLELNQLNKTCLDAAMGVEDLNRYRSLGVDETGSVLVSAHAYVNKIGFPSAEGPSALLYWKLNPGFQISKAWSIQLKEFHCPYNAFFLGNSLLIGGFMNSKKYGLSPFLFRMSTRPKLPLLELGPLEEMDFSNKIF